MEFAQNPELISLGVSLTQLAIKGTTTAITTKIRALKQEKDAEKLRLAYNELVNELLNERDEAVQIAQSYKSELEKVVISDEDMQHLHNTIERLLELVKKWQMRNASSRGEEAVAKVEAQVKSFEEVKELISLDTLKTMQLLGFNYKAAIGEPLTKMMNNFILSKVIDLEPEKGFLHFLTPEMVEVLKNKSAFDNLNKLLKGHFAE